MTAGEKLAADVAALVKSRNPIIWIVTAEEGRVERSVIDAVTRKARYEVRLWDCASGVTDVLGKELKKIGDRAFDGKSMTDIAEVLNAISANKERAVWILRDAPLPWLQDPQTRRRLRNLARELPDCERDDARSIIILSPTAEVPPDLADHAVVIKWELPDRAEIAGVLDKILEEIGPDLAATACPAAERDLAIEAAVGLTAEAASSSYSKSLVTQGKRILPAYVAAEKKRVVSGKGIEWFDADPRGLDAIGGLEYLKPWLMESKLCFGQKARDFGLPAPRGVFLCGISGCGKSLSAKATATAFGCPLLRADFGASQSKWVGESQANIRAVFAIAEAVGRCVLWIDEIEKSLAGATGGAADGGVSSDALGTFLQWMQERKGEVFVVATANDVTKLPPELLRKGRFDELFFVDLPTSSERADILQVTLRQFKRADHPVDLSAVVAATKEFTGSEIAALLPAALRKAYADGERQITTMDLVDAARATVPLSRTMPEKIEALREWSKTRARPASLPEVSTTVKGGRKLDM